MIQVAPVASVLGQVRPAQAVDPQNEASVEMWTQRLNVSRDDLIAAIAAVGPSVTALRRHLQPHG